MSISKDPIHRVTYVEHGDRTSQPACTLITLQMAPQPSLNELLFGGIPFAVTKPRVTLLKQGEKMTCQILPFKCDCYGAPFLSNPRFSATTAEDFARQEMKQQRHMPDDTPSGQPKRALEMPDD